MILGTAVISSQAETKPSTLMSNLSSASALAEPWREVLSAADATGKLAALYNQPAT